MQTAPSAHRPTVATIHFNHLTHNIQCLRERVQTSKIMAIVKANAYGHGLINVARHLEKIGVEQLGVAFLEEGIALRQAGIRLPVLVMGGIYAIQIEQFIRHDLEITVSSLDKLRAVEQVAASMEKTAIIHLKIDTGMERIGVHDYSCGPLIEAALMAKHCQLKGVYSHLACADDPDHPMTRQQIERYESVLHWFNKLQAPMPIRHLANSGAILHFPEALYDMVRPGIIMYGIYPDPASQRNLPVKPLMKLSSRVVFFKVVQPGRTVSYGATWQSDHPVRVVTVPVGYGDGLRRSLSNKGEVLIRNQRHPIVGRVCMDQFMVNLEWGTAYNQDEVVLIGTQGDQSITVEEMAEWADTIPYEILTGFNDRIPRVYVE